MRGFGAAGLAGRCVLMIEVPSSGVSDDVGDSGECPAPAFDMVMPSISVLSAGSISILSESETGDIHLASGYSLDVVVKP